MIFNPLIKSLIEDDNDIEQIWQPGMVFHHIEENLLKHMFLFKCSHKNDSKKSEFRCHTFYIYIYL